MTDLNARERALKKSTAHSHQQQAFLSRHGEPTMQAARGGAMQSLEGLLRGRCFARKV
jgi:hypothetical protein